MKSNGAMAANMEVNFIQLVSSPKTSIFCVLSRAFDMLDQFWVVSNLAFDMQDQFWVCFQLAKVLGFSTCCQFYKLIFLYIYYVHIYCLVV